MNDQHGKEQDDIVKNNQNIDKLSEQTSYRLKAAAFLAIIGSLGFFSGFGGAISTVKKQDPSSFNKGLTSNRIVKQVYCLNP